MNAVAELTASCDPRSICKLRDADGDRVDEFLRLTTSGICARISLCLRIRDPQLGNGVLKRKAAFPPKNPTEPSSGTSPTVP